MAEVNVDWDRENREPRAFLESVGGVIPLQMIQELTPGLRVSLMVVAPWGYTEVEGVLQNVLGISGTLSFMLKIQAGDTLYSVHSRKVIRASLNPAERVLYIEVGSSR